MCYFSHRAVFKLIYGECGVKKVFSVLMWLSVICVGVNLCHAATTSDGLITLDFFEDTQSSIENRWILYFTVNGVDYIDYLSSVEMIFENTVITFSNPFNTANDQLYSTGSLFVPPNIFYPLINSIPNYPTGTEITFYALLTQGGDEIIGDFPVNVTYRDNLGQNHQDTLFLTGPIDTIPEPFSMALFVFGLLFIRLFIKSKK